MFARSALFVACALLALVAGEEASHVKDLTQDSFKETVANGYWLVEFYAPWCGHCKKLAPTWEHLATQLAGKANIARVDCTAHKEICSANGVKGFPTIKLLHNGEESAPYSGARSATAFTSFLKEKNVIPADVVVADLPNAEAPPAAKPAAAAAAEPEGPTDVVVLTEANFEETTKTGAWFIKFYAPWCGHCKKLAPTWGQLATALKGQANIAKVDCTVHSSVCQKFGVKGYPTLKLIKDGVEAAAHQGARDGTSLATFLKTNNVISADVFAAVAPNLDKPVPPAKPAEKPADKPAAAAEPEKPTDVIVLTDADYSEKTKTGTWFVKFYAPWCGHCKRLAPTWDELATKVNKANTAVKVAKVDCTVNAAVCQAQGVRGYPTLKLFKDGVEGDAYKGGRDAESLMAFLTTNGFTPAAAEEAKAAHQEL